MKVKVIYRKNLKLTPAKLAAQVAHAVLGLNIDDPLCSIIVLQASDKKFFEQIKKEKCYVQVDAGLTEVEAGTETVAAWIEDDLPSVYRYKNWEIYYNQKIISDKRYKYDIIHIDYDGTPDTAELYFKATSLYNAINSINEVDNEL